MAKIDKFFEFMVAQGASDLHLTAGAPPVLRLHGEMMPMKYRELTADYTRALLFEIMTEAQAERYEETNDLDFAYELDGIGRFRCNFFVNRLGPAAVFRMIPTRILSAEELNLPPVVLKLASLKKGLVLVTGPTGSGKSTTLAAMIDYINATRREHILTIEDPIEFIHPNKRSLVNQREVESHTHSFSSALRASLREDPDVILVGEMRDLETIELAITAAETGHLVFGTLHTTSAIKTVDRIINVFPANQQEQIRVMLSESLQGVVSQVLLKRIDKKGRAAALEILIVTKAVSNLIRENKAFQILSTMQTGRRLGMQTLEQALLDLARMGQIDPRQIQEILPDSVQKTEPLRRTG